MYGVVILAAGNSKRMCSELPKVLHPLAGTPILVRTLMSVMTVSKIKQVVVVGGAKIDLIRSICNDENYNKLNNNQICWVQQCPPKGTADALLVGISKLQKQITKVIVISGDLPVVNAKTLERLISVTPNKGVGLLTGHAINPYGLGRIKRDVCNNFLKIIEESDATQQEQQINEINVGLYLFPKDFLDVYLSTIDNKNTQQEYYLTDLLQIAKTAKLDIITVSPQDPLETISVNTREQLILLERAYQLQQAKQFIQQGVTILDPERFDIRGEASIAQDVEIDVNVILVGTNVIEKGVKIGANCYIKDSIIKEHVVIYPNSVIDGATIHANASIGPFARIRPHTNIESNAKVGNFVEIKSSLVGKHSKINHLSYVGDAKIGNYVNIGAGTVTCNYDGVNKHITNIQDHAAIGAGCQLIAPIVIEKQATLAAGTTLMNNAPACKLTLNKKIQYSIEWQRPEKSKKQTINTKITER